jgi:hypothetical protein
LEVNMFTHTHRAAVLGALGLFAAAAATPAIAQSPAQGEPCSVKQFAPCQPDVLPAHHAIATVPGKSPIQAQVPDGRTLPVRPWLKAGN